MGDVISSITEDGIGIVLFNRGEHKSAVRGETMAELCASLDAMMENNSVRAIVLGSAGRHFVAGADFGFLDDLRTLSASQVKDKIYADFQGAARRLYRCTKPTVAAVNGAAVTVGCEIALACDFRIVCESTRFQESWIKLGLMPPLGGLYLLPRMVGMSRASEMVLQGRPVGGEEAMRIGLANELVEERDLHDRAQALARELADLPPLAYRTVKESLQRGADSNMENEWQANVLGQAMLIGSNDFGEGLAAVKERRSGKFSGS